MKLVVFRDNLKNGLMIAERAIADSTHLPILKNVLLKTIANKIQLITTNLELAISTFISGKIIEEGSLTIPFGTFYNIVTNTTNDRVTIEQENTTFIFKTDNYEAKIQGVSSDEFPLIPKIENTERFIEINSTVFREALQQIITAAQFSDIRPELGGVLFDFQMTLLKLVATDSFRLAEKTIPLNQFKHTITTSFKAIIPLRSAHELVRIISQDSPLFIFFDANQILFKLGDIELISRLIDSAYPDYEQIIPKETETEISIDRNHFINAIKLVSNFSGKTNDIRLAANHEQKLLTVYSINQFLGENNYLIPARLTGLDFTDVPFNWRYLLDGLKVIKEESIIFRINGNTKPALIRPTDDHSYLYIIMPIRL